jgi:hypothetical protein
VVWIEKSGKPKVGYLQHPTIIQEQVRALDVSMQHTMSMTMIQAL